MIGIALGANLPSRFGEPVETLQAAKAALLERGVAVTNESRTYLTEPVPKSDDPWYHNEVVAVETVLGPEDLLAMLHTIEAEFGRVRTVKNAPRLLDLDLISYHDVIVESEVVTVPHPRMHTRAFVLYPLQEIAPTWVHPVSQTPVSDLIAALPEQSFNILS